MGLECAGVEHVDDHFSRGAAAMGPEDRRKNNVTEAAEVVV